MRRGIFEREISEVRRHNAQPNILYKKGINHLSDWTSTELKTLRGLKRTPKTFNLPVANKWTAQTGVTVPHSLDYRTAVPSILTTVKDQGQCGSCWAHAATEGIESAYAIQTGELFVLSQQQLTSCVQNTEDCGGTGGCNGATVEVAWDYTTQNGGMTEEWMYSYQSYWGTTPSCIYSATNPQTKPFVQTSGYSVTSPRNDVDSVLQSLFVNGPLAISVDASNWNNYESGIYNGCDYANNISMDHAVQLVGYGTDAALGSDYWIVRNSWSASFGEQGFIRLVRESTPKCGWDNEWKTQGGGCNNDPNTVWACGQCGILYDTVFPQVVV
eukprot:GILK01010867.1.p1 GENE.GILK01010867.1~~GILK01010867.1.p1  ORF type:complete len:328 (-),score=11.54 GILK01010867.1:121-1104(-)